MADINPVDGNVSGIQTTKPKPELTDAGKYALSGLTANILAQLYSKDYEQEFRHKLLDDLALATNLSDGARRCQLAVADGEFETKPEPFIDLLLEEDLVKECPESLFTSFLLVALKDGVYDARVRVVVEHMSWLLRIDMKSIESIEDNLLEILKSQVEISEEEKGRAASKARNTKIKRGLVIGLATVVGGTVIGLTGGLAAPLIATGMGAIIGTAGGVALGSAAGVAVIGSLFGVAGAGLAGYKMKKRVGGIEQFEVESLTDGSQMAITIAISGWVNKGRDDFRTPWATLADSREQYYLKYESRYMQELGQSLDTLSGVLVTQAVTETLKHTALQTLIAAFAWPSALLAVASLIDNPWHVCTRRAENVGKHLAEVLIRRQQGHRPVSLVGFSLGARVIFHCMKALSAHPRGAGILENVYLMGTPVSGSAKEWEPFGRIVAGKIVNVYIRNDWVLKFLYRTVSAQFRVAGISPVEWDDRRMINMDLSHVITGHMDYMKKMPTVLEAIGFKTKVVHNVFATKPEADSGPATSALTSTIAADESPLLPLKVSSADSNEAADEPSTGSADKEVADDITSDDVCQLPYKKLPVSGNTESLPSVPAAKARLALLDQGETTDSDRSLAEKLIYEQLVEQGSSTDSIVADPQVKLKRKIVKAAVVRKDSSEKLFGPVSTRLSGRLVSSDSDSSMSADYDCDTWTIIEPMEQQGSHIINASPLLTAGEPSQSLLKETSQTQPTEPSQTQPTEPSQTQPTEPSQTKPTEPSQTQPTGPST